MKDGQFVGEIGDNTLVDLADVVELTPDGQEWIGRIKNLEIEEEKKS
ncbi:MAG: hypothetical protein F6K11_33610 [Leptolyngbya sp. SIO3F4]|nr:hypothetical protein [Leptolyngbya sp. SIO3F4]